MGISLEELAEHQAYLTLLLGSVRFVFDMLFDRSHQFVSFKPPATKLDLPDGKVGRDVQVDHGQVDPTRFLNPPEGLDKSLDTVRPAGIVGGWIEREILQLL